MSYLQNPTLSEALTFQITIPPSPKNFIKKGLGVKFLARLFSKKTLRYCHSPGAVGGGGRGVRKRRHFLISLLLLKIFT